MKIQLKSKILPAKRFRHVRVICFMILALGFSPTSISAFEFDSLCGTEGIECTYISGRFAENLNLWNRYNLSILGDNVDKNISALYTYDAISDRAAGKIQSLLKTYLLNQKDIELVMKNVADHHEYYLYQQMDKQDHVKQIIIWTNDVVAAQLVVIDYLTSIY